jgi:hypothetical protein
MKCIVLTKIRELFTSGKRSLRKIWAESSGKREGRGLRVAGRRKRKIRLRDERLQMERE